MAGIYVHIPFCRKKCIYCDFYSIGTRGLEDQYVNVLVDECAMRSNELGGNDVATLYIGGGTPSLLSPSQLDHLTSGIGRNVDLSKVEEFTIEVNPDDVTCEYISQLREIGVNRVSMGIQSFIDDELKIINRRHTAQQAEEAVAAIRSADIENISIDLIYGLPGQTLDTWQYSLDKAIALRVPHISCYNLSYEEGTKLYRMRESGKLTECSDEMCIAMYHAMIGRLRENGYEHYEVSNFALPGMYSRHNSAYWTGEVYLGLGASAHSYDGVTRSYNIPNVRKYIELIASGNLACEREATTIEERYDEYVMIHLRTSRGVDCSGISQIFGSRFASHFKAEAQRHIAKGLLTEAEGIYRLTDDGVMLSDMIIRDLMW